MGVGRIGAEQRIVDSVPLAGPLAESAKASDRRVLVNHFGGQVLFGPHPPPVVGCLLHGRPESLNEPGRALGSVEYVNRDRLVTKQGARLGDDAKHHHRGSVVQPVAAEGALHRLTPGEWPGSSGLAAEAAGADGAGAAAAGTPLDGEA
jgi:hypothetical protein